MTICGILLGTVISQINMIMNSDLLSKRKIFVLRDIAFLTEY